VPIETFVFSTDQLFEPSKDRLTEAGEAKLKALVPSLRGLGAHPITIVAHSDGLGFEHYNEELTQRLAQRVKDWFVVHGLAKAGAILARGVGSSQPLVSEGRAGGKDNSDGRCRNRRLVVSIDLTREVEAEKVAVKVPPSKESNEITQMALPPEMQQDLVDSSMKPVTEEDLSPQFTGTGAESGGESAHHNVSGAEWGGGGSNFGDNPSTFGSSSSFGDHPNTFGGNPVEYNAEGKRIVKITPDATKLEKQRKETIDAQNEFGLWRDH
jgi:hypothetical protein